MFENITPEIIKRNMLSRITTGLQIREGSFTNDLLSAAACEIAEVYHSMDAMIPMLILDETSGPYIDEHAAFFKIYRKEGTKATCKITFTGTNGTKIPAGITFSTAAGLVFSLNESVTIAGGSAVGDLTAINVGAEYNIGAGEIVYILKNYSGIESFTNSEASGGTDVESDAAFLSRFQNALAQDAIPVSGNSDHYMVWAKSVNGVAYARVYALWDGVGTVKVILAGQDAGIVDEATVTRCAKYIETQRPIGANVTVVSAGAMEFDVEAEIVVDSSTTKEEVQAALEASIRAYLRDLVETNFKDHIDGQNDTYSDKAYNVIYNRIYYIIFSTPGVLDCTSLKLLGSTYNITVPADYVPVLTGVTLV